MNGFICLSLDEDTKRAQAQFIFSVYFEVIVSSIQLYDSRVPFYIVEIALQTFLRAECFLTILYIYVSEGFSVSACLLSLQPAVAVSSSPSLYSPVGLPLAAKAEWP